MRRVEWIKHALEYLGGVRDDAPPGVRASLASAAWGLWWGFLLCLIILLSGQSSKFIYIDF